MTFLWIGAGNSKVFEPSKKKNLDLGIDNVPLAVDLRERVWVCDVGFNIWFKQYFICQIEYKQQK